MMLEALTDCTAIDAEFAELLREAEVITELTQRCMEENAICAQSQEEYAKRYRGYEQRYEAVKRRAERLQGQRAVRQEEADCTNRLCLNCMKAMGCWRSLIRSGGWR